jgi:hypothetical protein
MHGSHREHNAGALQTFLSALRRDGFAGEIVADYADLLSLATDNRSTSSPHRPRSSHDQAKT